MKDMSRPLSRRELLRASAAGAGVLTLGPFLAACGGDDDSGGGSSAATGGRGGELKMWWWGEQEAVGIQQWIDTTLTEFKKANDTGHADAHGHRQRRPAVHQRRRGGQAARRPVPLQRHLPHGERVAGLHRAAQRARGPGRAGRLRRDEDVDLRRQAVPRRLLLRAVRDRLQQGALREGRASTPTPRRRRGTSSPRRARSSSRPGTSRSAAASRTASSASGTSSTRSRRTSTRRPTR